jgi:hypothetical protein
MTMKDIKTMLGDKARELGVEADWYASNHAPSMSEQCLYIQRSLLHVIDLVHDECKTPDEVDELLDAMRDEAYEMYRFLQSEHFEHLAELVIVKYMALCEISADIERNK